MLHNIAFAVTMVAGLACAAVIGLASVQADRALAVANQAARSAPGCINQACRDADSGYLQQHKGGATFTLEITSMISAETLRTPGFHAGTN